MVLPNLVPVAMTIGPWPPPASGLILHPMDLALPPHHPPVPGSIYGRVTVKIPHLRRVVVILRIPPIPIKEVDIHREITGRHKVIALAHLVELPPLKTMVRIPKCSPVPSSILLDLASLIIPHILPIMPSIAANLTHRRLWITWGIPRPSTQWFHPWPLWPHRLQDLSLPDHRMSGWKSLRTNHSLRKAVSSPVSPIFFYLYANLRGHQRSCENFDIRQKSGHTFTS